jgi:hypothetical protein
MARYSSVSRSREKSTKAISATRKKYASGRPKTGEGYSNDRTGSDDTFQITIDFADFTQSMNSAKLYLGNFINNMYAEAKKSPGKNISNKMISIQLEDDEKGANEYRAAIKSAYNTERFRDAVYADLAPDLGRIGIDNVRDGIRNPLNAPKSFRYDTGDMYNAVDFRKRKTANGISITVGWTRKFYKYFDFQERGTETVGAMRAIQRGYRKTAPKAPEKMLQFMRNYTDKGGFSGRYTR